MSEINSTGIILILAGLFIVFFLSGIRIVRPTHRGLVERLGKYKRFAHPGFNWIIPVIDRMFPVNSTEQMVDALPQEIITNDNLNARVDAQVYFKVKPDEESVKRSQYNVNNYQYQIVNLARTTLRNIIGTMTLKSANSERSKINSELLKTLLNETASWGIDIVRTELKEIDPPKDVQETMNKVVKAENEKIAAIDYATATETAADGQKRSEIKKAEGIKAGEDPGRRRRGAGDQAGERGGQPVFRGQCPAFAETADPRDGPEGQCQDRRSPGLGAGQRDRRARRRRPGQEKKPSSGPSAPPARPGPGLALTKR